MISSFDRFFSYGDQSEAVQLSLGTGRRSFALEYSLNIHDQSLGLGLDKYVNITAPAVLPCLSTPFEVRAKAGDQDGVVLPWFSHADATLLSGQSDIYGQSIARISLRMRWVEDGKLELWPNSADWREA